MGTGLRWGALRCQPGYKRLHLVVLVLGGAASNLKLSLLGAKGRVSINVGTRNSVS